MYANIAPLWAAASMLLKVYSLLWLPLISSAQPSLLHLEDRLLIFCQKEKHTIIMLPFEIPSLSFCNRNKMHLIEMYVETLEGYFLG